MSHTRTGPGRPPVTQPRSHFENLFLIMNQPEKSFSQHPSDHEGKPRSRKKVSEKGFSAFRITPTMLF